MSGQSAIIGVGALEYPAEFQGASDQTLSELGISKIITLTSTYDHRVIQGAESGEFLRRIHQLLIGEDGFYDDVFTSLRLPYEPVRWVKDLDVGRHGAGRQDRQGAGDHRRLPHPRPPDGRHRSAELPAAPAPRPGRALPRADPVGPGPGVPGRRVQRPAVHEAARRPRRAARLLLPHRRRRVHAHHGSGAAQVDPAAGRGQAREAADRRAEVHPRPAEQRRGVRDLPADQVHRPEAVLPRGRRDRHRPAGRRAEQGRRVRHGRGRHRHGAPRPAERAGQHRRQALLADLPRVRGQHGPGPGPGLR